MRRTAVKSTKVEDDDKRGMSQQKPKSKQRRHSIAVTYPATTGVRRIPLAERSAKTPNPRNSQQTNKLVTTTPPPSRKKPPVSSRRTISPKPLCQRSQRRHEAFRAAFEKMTVDGSHREKTSLPPKKTTKQVKSRPTSKAGGGSMPPRLPSVRTSSVTPCQTPTITPTTTPSATPRRPRRRWFPESTPEIQYRPRSVREAAAQQKLREQLGANSLKLSPISGTTPRSALAFSPFSPEIHRHVDDHCPSYRTRSKGDSLYGQTPPPAEADADSERFYLEDDGWGVVHRYGSEDGNRNADRQQFRLKSQQLQYSKMNQYETDQHDLNTPMAIYERVEEEDVDFA